MAAPRAKTSTFSGDVSMYWLNTYVVLRHSVVWVVVDRATGQMDIHATPEATGQEIATALDAIRLSTPSVGEWPTRRIHRLGAPNL